MDQWHAGVNRGLEKLMQQHNAVKGISDVYICPRSRGDAAQHDLHESNANTTALLRDKAANGNKVIFMFGSNVLCGT